MTALPRAKVTNFVRGGAIPASLDSPWYRRQPRAEDFEACGPASNVCCARLRVPRGPFGGSKPRVGRGLDLVLGLEDHSHGSKLHNVLSRPKLAFPLPCPFLNPG